MTSRALNVAILLAMVVFGIMAVRWADGEFARVEPPTAESFRPLSRPEWVWALHRPYRRAQNAGVWVCVAATVGVGAILAADGRTWSRRGPSRPGTIVVLVILLVGGGLALHCHLAAPAIYRTNGTCYALRNVLEYRVPGAILGAWVVQWLWPRRRGRPDWRERAARLVGWAWMANVGLLIAYALLFG